MTELFPGTMSFNNTSAPTNKFLTSTHICHTFAPSYDPASWTRYIERTWSGARSNCCSSLCF